MSYLRFQHVFAGLMVLSALCAFAIPAHYAARFQPQVQWIFAPVSRPVRSVATRISNAVSPPQVNDHRAVAVIARENEELRERNAELIKQLQGLRQRDLEFSKLGDLRDHCRLVTVVGSDSGPRESIALGGSSLQGVREGMYVFFENALVGQVMRAGLAGAQVRLITDPGSRVRVKFVHYDEQSKHQELDIPGALAEGFGDGKLIVRHLTLEAIGHNTDRHVGRAPDHAVLREGDLAILSDQDCPALLQGKFVGRVLSIAPQPGARLFADIMLETTTSLTKLPEVFVMTTEE